MTEQKQLEEVRKLREGIAKITYQFANQIDDRVIEGRWRENSKERWYSCADFLLRTILSDLKVDMGKLTDWEEGQNALNGFVKSNPRSSVPVWFYSDDFRVMIKEVVAAARAKFVSTGEIVKERE